MVVWLADKLLLDADEVLNGRVDFEAVTARYVMVYTSGWTHSVSQGKELVQRLMLAVNFMAKLGWRVAGYSSTACVMENPQHV